jgi:major membrane immunogen (membrane-anchored lipoprotein)
MTTPSFLRASLFTAVALCLAACSTESSSGETIRLFDGKTLDGWKATKTAPEGTYKVVDGVLEVRGGKADHLFYVGPDGKASFTNFDFKAKVRTYKGANSGIYFHTAYQEEKWPAQGFECQVNASHTDRKRTGGLYAVRDVMDTPAAPDDVWFEYHIRVEGKRVQIWIDGKQTVDFTQPDDWTPPKGMPGRRLGSGTFALQAHDPTCKVDYKDIVVQRLP